MDMNFASDNVVGASQRVLDAMVAANRGPLPSYGADPITAAVERRLAAIFERDLALVLPVATGTAANALALAAALSPWGLCVCHAEAHILEDECGAPEFFAGGAKLLGMPGVGGKLAPGAVAARLDALPRHEKQMPAEILSLSQATEAGTVYSVDEIAALAAVAHERGLAVHMDGARFANALVRLGVSPADMTWRAGIDILSFGATKNGCLAAEAVIVFDPPLAATLRQRRKRSGHTLSKGRLLSSQLDGYLRGDHWLADARHANGAADRLSAGLGTIAGVRLPWPVEANEVFAILPETVAERLRGAGIGFAPWASDSLPPGEDVRPGEHFVRFVLSFATEAAAVERLLAVARDESSDLSGN